MLLKAYCQYYQAFQQALQHLQILVTKANPESSSLQAAFLEAQQVFQLQIMSLNLDELDAKDRSKVQSYQTEMNKQLRLLGMDVMFLQSARRSATAQQRQAQISDRIATLIRYCDVFLQDEDQ